MGFNPECVILVVLCSVFEVEKTVRSEQTAGDRRIGVYWLEKTVCCTVLIRLEKTVWYECKRQ
jgi:hypothetical protein